MSHTAPAQDQPTTAADTQALRSSHQRSRRTPRRLSPGVRRSLLLVPVLAVAVGLSAACAEEAPQVPNLPPIPTALPSNLPTALPTSVPTSAPTDVPADSGAKGTPIGFDGALLQPADIPAQTSAGADASCEAVVDTGWTVDDCGAVANYVWVVARQGAVGDPGTGWQAYIAYFDSDQGQWVKLLGYADPSGESVTSITGRTAPLSGAGEDVIFAYRNSGTGDILSYDIVGTSSDPTILAHREISHGTATLDGPSILDTEAEYPNGEPNCCPAYFQLSRVTYHEDDGQFYVAPVAQQGEPNQGDF
jgi:hypothetical protein